MSRKVEVERRALALIERIADRPGDMPYETRLLQNEDETVIHRVAALKRAMTGSSLLLPTEFAADAAGPLVAPEKVGPFRLVRRIGEGGMGGVWLGERDDGLYHQRVAVKLIRPGLIDLAGQAFINERRILARLEHPGIGRLIDGGVTPEGLPYFIMELVEGIPIDEAAQGLDLAQAVKLFVKAADAVQFAHSRLVVHADIKPSNILVDAQGRVKLLDFGIARLIEAEGEGEHMASPMTAAYASPQRIAGAPPAIADDVFALGLVLRAMLPDAADADLAAIMAKASAPEEKERYGSVAALIADLDRWRDRLPVAAQASTVLYRARKFIARHRVGVIATGCAVLVLASLAAIATRNAAIADRASHEAEARFADARGAARLVSSQLLGQLADRPGTFMLRSRAAQAAQFYLDRLAASPNAPADIRLEAAQGLQRVAEAQAKPGVPNLGLTDAGLANLTRALDLAAPLPGDQARLLTISILLDRARLACFGRNDIDGALRDLDRVKGLLGTDDHKPDALRARYLVELASAREWHSDYPQAISAAKAALAYIPPDDQRDHVLLRSTALDLLAEAIYYKIDGAQSIAPYREALAALTGYDARRPGDQTILRRISRAEWALGSTLVDYGDRREAVRVLTQSAERATAISHADPADQDARRMVRIAENARGQALAKAGQVEAGIAIIQRNIAERRAYLDARPNDPMRLRDYMVAIKALGDMQIEYGRPAAGCATYGEARKLIALIRSRGQLTALDLSSVVRTLEEVSAQRCGGGGK